VRKPENDFYVDVGLVSVWLGDDIITEALRDITDGQDVPVILSSLILKRKERLKYRLRVLENERLRI
jgi:hypothetical protein